MTYLEDRIRTGLHEAAQRIPDTAPVRTRQPRQWSRSAGVWIVAGAVVAVLVVLTPILLLRAPSPDPAAVIEPGQFGGEWVADQSDGTTHTMTIEVSDAGTAETNIEDDFASVCSGAPFQVTGPGTFQANGTLVFNSPMVACRDGSQPVAPTGPPLDDQYRELTFTYDPTSDTLTDSLDQIWTRNISNTLGINWPQTNPEQVKEAQALADAGDPNYTWQLAPNLEAMIQGDASGDTPEILARFLQEELGWQEIALVGGGDSMDYGRYRLVGAQLLRCDPGRRNPLWPDDPRLGSCAPTLDEQLYERVVAYVTQPDKQGPNGIWVASFLTETDQFQQNAPITGDEIAALVDGFVQARVAGEGAERFLGNTGGDHVKVGYLYGTSTGAPYQRGEFEIEDGDLESLGPLGGAIRLKVRLFAEGGQTVTEQTFRLEPRGDSWLLFQHVHDQTTENGVPLPPPGAPHTDQTVPVQQTGGSE